jgi:TRAP-type C4-dicarboxylate transport system permease small subunit
MTRFRNIVVRYLSAALGTCVIAMTGLAVLQVVLRYVFAASLIWVEEVSVIIMLWMTWLGVTVLWLTQSHIAVDFLTSRLSQRTNRALVMIFNGIAIIIAGAILWASRETLSTMVGMELDTLAIDLSIKYYPVPIGAVGLGLAAFLDLCDKLRKQEVEA